MRRGGADRLADALEAVCARLAALCGAGAMAALAYLLAVTALGVAARAAFDLSGGAVNLLVPGLFEQSAYALAALVFLSPAGSAGGGLVRVELLSNAAPRRLAALGERLWATLLTAFAGALSALLGARAWRALGDGEVSQDLGLPLAPVYALAAFGCAAWALIALLGALAPARAARLRRGEAAAAEAAPARHGAPRQEDRA